MDQFFTNPTIANTLVSQLAAQCSLGGVARIVEPSAGAGAFCQAIDAALSSKGLLTRVERCYMDIEPRAAGIVRVDSFLNWAPPPTKKRGQTWVVGNPPFGTRAALALQFFNHAAHFADLIAFIMPPSFFPNKDKAIDPHFQLVHTTQLPVNAFLLPDNTTYDAAAEWQIWQRLPDGLTRQPRAKTPKPTYKHVADARREPCDLYVQRVGSRAGKITWANRPVSQRNEHHNFLYVKITAPLKSRIIGELREAGFTFERGGGGTAQRYVSKGTALGALEQEIDRRLKAFRCTRPSSLARGTGGARRAGQTCARAATR